VLELCCGVWARLASRDVVCAVGLPLFSLLSLHFPRPCDHRYGAYALNEALELSGIMALFFCGIVLAHYNSYNLSESSRAAAEVMSKTLAQISEFFIFLYMGLGFGTGRFVRWDAGFIVLTIAACLAARVFNTFPLSWLANLRRPEKAKIGTNMQVVLWFSGMRGAIAFALSQSMPGPNRDLYVSTTLSVVLFTTVVCGALTAPLLGATGMRSFSSGGSGSGSGGSAGSRANALPGGGENHGGDDESDDEAAPLVKGGDDGEGGALRRWGYSSDRHGSGARRDFRGFWRDFDERYVKPTFGGSAAQSSDDMPTAAASSSGQKRGSLAAAAKIDAKREAKPLQYSGLRKHGGGASGDAGGPESPTGAAKANGGGKSDKKVVEV